jgi:hypothetical protein
MNVQIVGGMVMASRVKKSWREKLADSKGLPKVVTLAGKARAKWGSGTLVVPAPQEVDEQMRRVPRGRVATVNDIRAALARKHGTTIGCPLVTGIFAWVAAYAAEEAGGGRGTTPYWRTLKAGGEINPKFPGGVAAVARRLKAEGHKVVKRGKRYFVDGYEKALVAL